LAESTIHKGVIIVTAERVRRIRGEGSFAQRANGLWVGTVDLGWSGGRRIRKSVSAKTKKEAQRKFADLKRDVERGVVKAGSVVTVEAWLNHWLNTIASERIRPRTLQGYRSYANVWLIPYLGAHPLSKLTEDHVRSLYRTMKNNGKSDATRRQAHAILRRALVVAHREGRVSRNVAANVDPPPVGVNHRKPLTLQQARKVLNSLDGDPLAARWIAALLLGMRQGECLGLRWQDVDLKAGVIHVRHEILRITGKGLVLGPPKSKTSVRDLPILGPMAYALEHTEDRGDYVFYGHAKEPRADYQAWKDLLVRGLQPAPFYVMSGSLTL
jgi:integrase